MNFLNAKCIHFTIIEIQSDLYLKTYTLWNMYFILIYYTYYILFISRTPCSTFMIFHNTNSSHLTYMFNILKHYFMFNISYYFFHTRSSIFHMPDLMQSILHSKFHIPIVHISFSIFQNSYSIFHISYFMFLISHSPILHISDSIFLIRSSVFGMPHFISMYSLFYITNLLISRSPLSSIPNLHLFIPHIKCSAYGRATL